ncbi:hypothetical protein C2S53_004165 [Perilla frutescens var. hirtella]|uniref:Piwi domain-containing protein n=1 Tax=Perilla frutescens var. hirtella TaxID=608512 RepID=A0AAD4PCS6_PERFH|nr:hypothetical protein C2S53_004165 [Perilla frutescens var. hirtella]
MYNGQEVNNGRACINFSTLKMDKVDGFCQELISVCCGCGMILASIDWPELSRYRAVFSTQAPTKETIKPDIFRLLVKGGGLREGQNSVIFQNEVNTVKKVCAFVCQNAKITFVVAQNRHHTRLFKTHDQNFDYTNVDPVPPILYASLAAERAHCCIAEAGKGDGLNPLLEVHPNLREKIFYC